MPDLTFPNLTELSLTDFVCQFDVFGCDFPMVTCLDGQIVNIRFLFRTWVEERIADII